MSSVFSKSFFSSSLHNHIDRMLIELELVERLASQHSGEKGREAEGILSGFLKSVLPRKWSVDTGFIMDIDTVSMQTDIIIHNDLSIPPLYSGYSNKIIPINSLGCAIEVKMNLTNELQKGCPNIVKCHDSAMIIKKMHTNLKLNLERDKKIELGEIIGEPLCIVFCYETGYALDTIMNKLNEIQVKTGDVAIDLFVVIDKGLVFLKSDKSGYVAFHAKELEEVGQETKLKYKIKKEHMLIIEFFIHLMNELQAIRLFDPNYLDWGDSSIVNILK